MTNTALMSTVSVTKSLSLAIAQQLPSIHTGTQLTPHARATRNTYSVSVVETPGMLQLLTITIIFR